MTDMPVISEEQEQELIFQWAAYEALAHPELRMLYAIPNGGKRSKATAARLKATGVKPGVPDMCLPVPNANHHGLYIELKRKKGGKVSQEQQIWLGALSAFGYQAMICKGFEEAKEVICEYLGIKD